MVSSDKPKTASDNLIPQLLQNDADIMFAAPQNRHFCSKDFPHELQKAASIKFEVSQDGQEI